MRFASRTLLFALLFAAMVLTVACSGGDDDDDGGDAPLPRQEPSVAASVVEPSPTPTADTGDEEFVTVLCQAIGTLSDDVSTVAAQLNEDDPPEEVLAALATPMQTFRDSVDRAEVTGDLVGYQRELVDAADDLIEVMEDGDPSAIEDVASFGDLPAPPEETRERLQAVAADLPQCAGIMLFD